jgi:hypothetical protein
MITAESLWFTPQTWHDEVPLIDPSHMKAKDIDTLYNHWAKRQHNGKEPVFGFVEGLEKHKREKVQATKKATKTVKRKWVEPETDSEEEPSIQREPRPVASQPRASGSGEKRKLEKIQIDEESGSGDMMEEEGHTYTRATKEHGDGDEPGQEVTVIASKKGKERETPVVVAKKGAIVVKQEKTGDLRNKKR